ncbi:neutral zinc metallopeptidase [Micromonospora sp. NBC_01796]|uniref:neutral zinc metallopeptidase n=1 Tax=Micromonospora sp. NBC_01796 TaxID=2975987 RepID=UPI002DD9F48B|nr:neutral zinc metallopeptidase [Micromonospora sp. NBC_01796]WSA85263.1 neutral zinc metallopeptidase [Micromonospora sp. NBC_01796]
MQTATGYRSGRGAGLLGLVTVLVVTLACAIGPTTPGEEPAPAPAPSSGEPVDGSGTVEEFERDIPGAVRLAEQYWDERFTESRQRFQPVRRVFAYSRDGEVSCGEQAVPRNNAVYCPAGDFIAYDVNWAVAAFRQIGDAFLFFLLGHEYAHAIQARLGIQHQFTIQAELQADCMAGAYIGDSVQERQLDLQDGDLDEFRAGLVAVGDDPDQPWFAEGSHGTAEQRIDSFFRGYERSFAACDLT